jgi:hypothetical protein
MKLLTQAVYAIVGAAGVGLGALAVFAPATILPEAAAIPLAGHLLREQGAGYVFIGLMAFWCLRHFDRRRQVHYAFLAFTGLLAVIHWMGYFSSGRYAWAAAANTVPLLAFAVTAPISAHDHPPRHR